MPWLIVGLLGLVGYVLWSKQSSANPALPPSQTPVWAPLAPGAGTTVASVPANATFAVSLPSTDPQAAGIVASLQQGAPPVGSQLAAIQVYPPGSSPPAGWPSDGLGTSAYRVTGVAGPMPLSLSFDQSMRAWTFAGVVSGG